MRLARRFRTAFWTSVAASAVAIFLAVVPNWGGSYDPNLAVLTATLIAIIWYTFFTYCALHKAEESRLQYDVRRSVANRMADLRINNPTRDRRITVRFRLKGQRNGTAMKEPERMNGGPAFTLVPGETYERNFVVPAPTGVANYGPRVQMNEPEEAILRLDIVWQDDLGDRGTIGPEFWALTVLDCDTRRWQDDAAARTEWRKLGGQELPGLTN
jgi:hypothetical protein